MKNLFRIALLGALLVAACGCCKNSSLNKGLVIHSDFEKDATDASANHFDGKLVGAVLSDDAVVGKKSVYFDGVDDYVEYPAGNVYFEGDYSISVWVKWETCKMWARILDFNQDAPMSGNAVTWLIGRPERGTENNMWFDQWVQYDGKAVESILSQRNVSPADAYVGHNVSTGVWEHYVLVYDSSAENPNGVQPNTKGENVPLEGVVTLYVNGQKAGENTHCLKPQHVATVANWLGRSRFAADPYFNGWMDDFRLYDRKLDEKEVLSLYKLGK